MLQRFVRGGDREAFTELVRQYAGLVYGTCLRVLADADQAADATAILSGGLAAVAKLQAVIAVAVVVVGAGVVTYTSHSSKPPVKVGAPSVGITQIPVPQPTE